MRDFLWRRITPRQSDVNASVAGASEMEALRTEMDELRGRVAHREHALTTTNGLVLAGIAA